MGLLWFSQPSEECTSEDDIKDNTPEALNGNQQENLRAVICGNSYSGTNCGLSVDTEEETVGEALNIDQARLQIDGIVLRVNETESSVAAEDDGVVEQSKECHGANVEAKEEQVKVPPVPFKEVH